MHAQPFDIVLDPASLERSALGSITGCVLVQSGGIAFPESSWRDFPAIVIRWWIDAARALETGRRGASPSWMAPLHSQPHRRVDERKICVTSVIPSRVTGTSRLEPLCGYELEMTG